MRDERTNERTVKIELLSQWKLEAEFRNLLFTTFCWGYSLCGNSPNAIFQPEGRNNQTWIYLMIMK